MSTYKARKEAANKGKFSNLKLLTTSALTAASLVASGHAVAEPASGTTPGFTIEEGVGTVDTSTAGLEVITQGSHVLKATAPKINLARDAKLQILGQGKSDIFAGRATSRTGLSQLFGKVEANGIVVFTDPNGFVVGQSFVADVNSIVLGSGDLSIEQLGEGDRFTFFNTNEGAKIEIHEGATINVAQAGIAAFVAPTVKNAGTINAKVGRVDFAAGEKVTLDLYGDGLFEVQVEGELADAYLENTGAINAQGGVVQMTALAAKDVADNIINLDGVVDVSSATQKGGKIVLSGGNKGAVSVKGKVDASGKDGGEIEITGQAVIAEAGAELDASGTEKGGDIRFGGAWEGKGDTPTSEYAYVAQSAILRSNSGEGFDGGEVVVWSDLATFFYGNIEAAGGRVETSGKDFLDAFGTVTAAEWLLDPRNLEITDSTNSGNNVSDAPGIRTITAFNPGGAGNTSRVSDGRIEFALNLGADVTLRTGGIDNGDGDIFVNAQIDKTAGGEATLRLEAHDDIFVNRDIISTSGELNVELIAEAFGGRFGDQNIVIANDIITNGGDFTSSSENFSIDDGSDSNHDSIVTDGGNVNISVRDDVIFASNGNGINRTLIDAGTGTVTFGITAGDTGSFSLGDDNGGIHLSQAEIAAIDAGALTVGDDDTSAINVSNVDTTTATIDGLVTLNTGNVSGGGVDDVNFAGINKFKSLTVNSDDDITFANGTVVETTDGDATFNGDENNGSVGDFVMGVNAAIVTNGNNAVIDALSVVAQDLARIETAGGDVTITTSDQFGGGTVDLNGRSFIDADGGDITINNDDIFTGGEDSLRTNTEGTILVNQHEGGSLQNAIDAMDNTGTGQNTILAHAGTYNENLTINQANLKLNGLEQGVIAGPDVIISGDGTNPVISVEASNFNLDPVVVDANGADYGLVADGVGAIGLISDGNTFIDSAEAGIYVAANAAGTGTIVDNTFEGSATRGVKTGTLDGGYTLDILNNTIGTDGDEVVNGLLIGEVRDATVNITGGSIESDGGGIVNGDAIHFASGLFENAIVNITNVTAKSDGDEAIDVQGAVRSGSEFNVTGGTYTGAANGVEFSSIQGDVTLTNITSVGETRRGLNLLETITGDITITGGSITGELDGIGSNHDGNFITGANIVIEGVQITGTTENGISLKDLSKGANVRIDNNTINAAKDGVKIDGGISASTLQIAGNNEINANEDGIEITGALKGATVRITSDANPFVVQDINAGKDGIIFGGDIINSTVTAGGQNVDADNGDAVRFDGTIDNSRVTIGVSDVTNPTTTWLGGNHTGSESGIVFKQNVQNGSSIEVALGSPFAKITGENGDGVRFEGDIDASNVRVTSSDIEGQNGAGINFEGDVTNASTVNIDDQDIAPLPLTGSTLFTGTRGNTITGSTDGVKFAGVNSGSTVNILNNTSITGGADGVVFEDSVTGSTVTIADNDLIDANGGSGIAFRGEASIDGGSTVNIDRNDIEAALDGIVVVGDTEGTDTALNIRGNDIEADQDGIDIDNVNSGATVTIGGALASQQNTIEAALDGIEFDAGIDSTVTIENNIISAGEDGIHIEDADGGAVTAIDNGATVSILNNKIGSEAGTTIGDDGIDVDDNIVNGSTLTISGNTIGRSNDFVNDDGIDLENITGSTVTITNNDVYAVDNGVEINGVVNNSTVTISGNNDGFATGDHGIYFGDNINGGSDVTINGNIIQANLNRDSVGAGIFFDGTVTDATVTIGNGNGGNVNNAGSTSNVISVRTTGGNSDNLDGIHFDKEIGQDAVIDIDGNRIGYTANTAGGNVSTFSGYNRRIAGDGIEFKGPITGNADIDVEDNHIRARGDGVKFSGEVRDFATILVGGKNDRNTISAFNNGVSFLGNVTGQAIVEIVDNAINAGNDGILFGGAVNNADLVAPRSQQEILIADNDIDAEDNGINFVGPVSGRAHDQLITGNSISTDDDDGIVYQSNINGASINIIDGNNIDSADRDAIAFRGNLQGARVNINNNENIIADDGDGVEVEGNIVSSTLNINNNSNIDAGDNGVEIGGFVASSTVNINGNNHGIHADDHGIIFEGDIFKGSNITINDNIISANEDNGSIGDGIHFGGNIFTANIQIGDGSGASFFTNPSNFIRGRDGIHFAGFVTGGADIDIDGNRIGYGKTPSGRAFSDRVNDDGIQFIGSVSGNADIEITDNYINARDDGISFISAIRDRAKVLIGGKRDTNTIFAGNDGIQLQGDITDNALIEISSNNIDAENEGIEFNGDIDNVAPNGVSQQEILIAHNDIDVEDGNGILFTGTISNRRHDTLITKNTIEVDNGGLNGIRFARDITDATVNIVDGNNIDADEDGIVFDGDLSNARVRINNNGDITSDDQDGIDFNGDITNGSFVSIANNESIRGDLFGLEFTTDSGIEFEGVSGSRVQILENEIMAEDHGIIFKGDLADGSDVDIHDNIIMSNTDGGRDGAGIFFDGTIRNTDLNIGDGTLNGAPSNIISVGGSRISRYAPDLDGIHFDDRVGRNANVVIDGNRIGYKVGKEESLFESSIPDDGIEFAGGIRRNANIEITDNRINANDDGIVFSSRVGDDATITIGTTPSDADGNIITAGDDGIEFDGRVFGDAEINIIENEINADDNGVNFDRVAGGNVNIIANTITDAGGNGIRVAGTGVELLVDANEISGSGENGILLIARDGFSFESEGSFNEFDSDVRFFESEPAEFNSTITGNNVDTSGEAGLNVAESGHDSVVVAGNTFTNNPTGARFESGAVDLTGDANTFIVTPDFETPEGFDFITGMQFDIQRAGTPVADLSIVGNTLGTTVFEGYGPTTREIGESFYVRIEDDALLDGVGGAPIVIDGTFASWDGLIPNLQGNILSPQQLLDIENFIFDADDLAFDGRGQIFVGSLATLNFEDFIREFGASSFGASGLSVTVLGLPAIDGANLAAIQPAAGGEGEGNSAEDLADLEPAAGESEEAACWGDAINAASTGAVVNYSFGGTFEESLADASTCQSEI